VAPQYAARDMLSFKKQYWENGKATDVKKLVVFPPPQ
jgi:hypothetical protein